MTHPTVAAFLSALPPDTREIVQALRNVVRRNLPEAEETFLWGGISYHRPKVGGRVKGAICNLEVKGHHVHLGFIHGVRLSDPRHLLKGNGVSKRFLTVETAADAEGSDLVALIKKAAALNPSAWA